MDNRIHAQQPTSTWSALDLTETMRRLPVISPRKLQRQSTDEPDLLTNWMMCPCLDSHSVAIPIRPTHRRTERATAGIFSIISSYVHMSSKVFITTPSSAIPIIIYYSLVPPPPPPSACPRSTMQQVRIICWGAIKSNYQHQFDFRFYIMPMPSWVGSGGRRGLREMGARCRWRYYSPPTPTISSRRCLTEWRRLLGFSFRAKNNNFHVQRAFPLPDRLYQNASANTQSIGYK